MCLPQAFHDTLSVHHPLRTWYTQPVCLWTAKPWRKRHYSSSKHWEILAESNRASHPRRLDSLSYRLTETVILERWQWLSHYISGMTRKDFRRNLKVHVQYFLLQHKQCPCVSCLWKGILWQYRSSTAFKKSKQYHSYYIYFRKGFVQILIYSSWGKWNTIEKGYVMLSMWTLYNAAGSTVFVA